MLLVKFFLQAFLFWLAMFVATAAAYVISVNADIFPPPPPAWVSLIHDARETSRALEMAAVNLRETGSKLEWNASTLLPPLKETLELVKQILDRVPAPPEPSRVGRGQPRPDLKSAPSPEVQLLQRHAPSGDAGSSPLRPR